MRVVGRDRLFVVMVLPAFWPLVLDRSALRLAWSFTSIPGHLDGPGNHTIASIVIRKAPKEHGLHSLRDSYTQVGDLYCSSRATKERVINV